MAERHPLVDTYLDDLAEERREALDRLRSLVFEVAPDAEESIKYGMPYYTAGGALCAFASQKRYISLYIFDTEIVRRYREALQGLDVGKSCIRFRKIEQLPLEVIASMLAEAYRSNRTVEA